MSEKDIESLVKQFINTPNIIEDGDKYFLSKYYNNYIIYIDKETRDYKMYTPAGRISRKSCYAFIGPDLESYNIRYVKSKYLFTKYFKLDVSFRSVDKIISNLNDTQIKFITEHNHYNFNGELLALINFKSVNFKDFLRILYNRAILYAFDDLTNVSIKELLEVPVYSDVGVFRDYLRMRKELNKILDIKFKKYPDPRDLFLEHDMILKRFNSYSKEIIEMQNKELNEQYNNVRTKLLKYEYIEDDYSIIVPNSLSEITREGTELCHCVGSYINQIVQEDTIILFLRYTKEFDKPFYTLNLSKDGSKILQLHGKYNRLLYKESDHDSIYDFMSQWCNLHNIICTNFNI